MKNKLYLNNISVKYQILYLFILSSHFLTQMIAYDTMLSKDF